MRPRMLVTVCAMLVLIPATDAAAATQRCAAKKSQTVKQTKHVRVYTTARGSNWYACFRRTGRKSRLDEPQGQTFGDGGGVEDDLYSLRVAGRFVAYWQDGADYPTGVEEEGGLTARYFSTIVVWDARRGEEAMSSGVDGAESLEGSTERPSADVTRIVLRPTGSVAWIARAGEVIKVNALQRGGRFETLDPGPRVDDASLTLRGSLARWTNAGSAKSATLR